MPKFQASANVTEVNRYDFVVEAETKEEADSKLRSYLKTNCPYPHDSGYTNGVMCVDRESGMETGEVKSVTIK